MDSTTDDVSRVRKELAHLDPWSFWIVSSTHGKAVDFVVVGTTGAFVIAISSLSGYVKEGAARLIVGKHAVHGLWKVGRIVKKVRSRLLAMAVDVPVEPIVCLTRAYPAPAASVRGMRVLSIDQLVADIAGRNKILDPARAEKAAQKLRSAV